MASNERISKYNFGCQIAKIFGYSEDLVFKASINNFKNLTKRPREMSLSNHKLNTFTGGTVPSIEKQLEKKIDIEFVESSLDSDYGWEDAVKNCDIILHTASPFPKRKPKDEYDLISTA